MKIKTKINPYNKMNEKKIVLSRFKYYSVIFKIRLKKQQNLKYIYIGI